MTLPQPTDAAAVPPLTVSADQVELFASVFRGGLTSGEAAGEADYRDHLCGLRQLSLGPSPEGTVGFAVFDFRRRFATTWKSDAVQFAADARKFGVSVYLEALPARSAGLQAWIFFEQPLPVAAARYVAGALLDKVSGGNPGRFQSFGRVFPDDPSAAVEPVALPLFGGLRPLGEGMWVARERGLPVLPDQWAVLASVARISHARAAMLAPGATLPPAEPTPADQLEATLSASLILRRPLPPAIATRLRQRLSFPNPEFLKRAREGRKTRGVPRLLPGWRRVGDAWAVPLGLEAELASWCESEGLGLRVLDARWQGQASPRTVPPGLPPDARALLDRVLPRERALVMATSDFTRTSVALAAVAEGGLPALIVTQNKLRGDFWRDQALMAGFDEGEVVGLRESLVRAVPLAIGTYADVPAQAGRIDTRFGLVVVDDLGRVPIKALLAALACLPTARTLGLSDEAGREDGLQGLVELVVGPPVRAASPTDEPFLDVVQRATRFVYQGPDPGPDGEDGEMDLDGDDEGLLFSMPRPVRRRAAAASTPARSRDWQALLDAVGHDEARNLLVAGDVEAEAAAGHRCLVLTERREHAQALTDLLVGRGVAAALLTGAISVGRRREALEQFREGRVKVLVVMEQLLGPGFDPSAVTRVFLAAPLRNEAKARQTVESLQRGARGEAIRLYDYMDESVPRLARMAARRRRFYVRANDALQLRLPFDEA